MRTIFALASGRSGTRFLCDLFRRNTRCVTRHETYFGNPSMFGRPIYDHTVGDTAAVRAVLDRKQRVIARHAPATYVETSHAFLKSYYDLAPEYFPDLKLVHLVRNPLKVAKSLTNRQWVAMQIPFSHYRGGDGRRYFRWSLTGLEPIYQAFDRPLTCFQRHVLEWIEIENRAATFLNRNGMREHCVTLRVPEDFRDSTCVREMFDGLEVPLKDGAPKIGGWKNCTPGIPTVITAEDERQFGEVLSQLPPAHLSIFHSEPYTDCEWSRILRK